MDDPLFSDMEQAAAAVYLFLLALIVFSGVVYFMGYRVVGAILVHRFAITMTYPVGCMVATQTGWNQVNASNDTLPVTHRIYEKQDLVCGVDALLFAVAAGAFS